MRKTSEHRRQRPQPNPLRRLVTVALALGMLPSAIIVQAQRALLRVGLLWIDSDGDSSFVVALREGLSAQGYTDGKNIRIENQFLVDRYDRLGEAAAKLVDAKVDVIVCYGTTATLAMRKATSTIPIVTVTGSDPVKLGVVASLSKPGGNVTGVTLLSGELQGKRLEILKEVLPRVRRIGVVFNPESANEVNSSLLWGPAAQKLNMEVRRVEIRFQSDIDGVIAELPRQGLDALGVAASTMFVANRRQIVTAVAKSRLPAIYNNSVFTDAGGLISYGANSADGFRRAGGYVARILQGAKPADLPVEQSTKFELAVNLKTARGLGITIPQTILLRADKLIE